MLKALFVYIQQRFKIGKQEKKHRKLSIIMQKKLNKY